MPINGWPISRIVSRLVHLFLVLLIIHRYSAIGLEYRSPYTARLGRNFSFAHPRPKHGSTNLLTEDRHVKASWQKACVNRNQPTL